MLPESISNAVANHLESDIQNEQAVHGGDINQAAKITLKNGDSYFLKWNVDAEPTMFASEAKGLELLGSAGTDLHIPEVIFSDNHFLIMEWIEQGSGSETSSYAFGKQLALLHKTTSDHFGLDHDNFIGLLPQSNSMHSNWPDFYTIERIEPQIRMAIENGRIDRSIFNLVRKLYTRLGNIFPVERPALLHGDLWSGNYMFDSTGKPSIFDPAVYYGHREMDISMTKLFGGFSDQFYVGYNEEYPLEDGFEARIKLCNLYPILVHANLFGGSYCRQAEQIIRHHA